MKKFNKIFGVGLPRCAGQSLMHAIYTVLRKNMEGPLVVCHSFERRMWTEDWRVKQAQGVTEVYLPYEYLERRFPGSLYILNTRQVDLWLESCGKHYRDSVRGVRGENGSKGCWSYWNHPLWLQPLGAFEVFYNKWHHEWMNNVKYYTSPLPLERLLVWDITENPSWGPLCSFLGVDAPDDAFPNTDKHRKTAFLIDEGVASA